MGKMISTTEELAEVLAEADCASTEPADAASKGTRVLDAMIVRFLGHCKVLQAVGAPILVELTRRMIRKTEEKYSYLLYDGRMASG